MKKAAATLSNGINATSAQAGKARTDVLITPSPLAGEGGAVGRRKTHVFDGLWRRMRGRAARRTQTPTRRYSLHSGDRFCGRPKSAPDGADPTSGPPSNLPPQGGKVRQRSPSSPRPSCRALADAGHQQAEVL